MRRQSPINRHVAHFVPVLSAMSLDGFQHCGSIGLYVSEFTLLKFQPDMVIAGLMSIGFKHPLKRFLSFQLWICLFEGYENIIGDVLEAFVWNSYGLELLID